VTIRRLVCPMAIWSFVAMAGCAPRKGSVTSVPATPSSGDATAGAISIPISQIPVYGPPYTDSVEGMKVQMGAAFRVWRTTDKSEFVAQLNTFALDNPVAWFSDSFGSRTGKALVPGYESSFAKFKSHVSWVSGNWSKEPDAGLVVEDSAVPAPPGSVAGEAMLPVPLVPLRIENFRFTVTVKGRPVESWVFSFVFVDGAYRIVGGTFPFWWELLIHRQIPEQVKIK
jgi:hypothetical protein